MATKLKTLPAGHRIVETAHGNYIQKVKRRRKTYKMPKAQRQKIAAAARKIKIPALTTAAVLTPTIKAWRNARALTGTDKLEEFGCSMLAYYTGFYPKTGDFKFSRLSYGLFPLLAVVVVRKLGVFKGVNSQLAKMKIPLRLS